MVARITMKKSIMSKAIRSWIRDGLHHWQVVIIKVTSSTIGHTTNTMSHTTNSTSTCPWAQHLWEVIDCSHSLHTL